MRPWGYQNLVLDPKAAFRTAWNQAWTRHWCWTVTCHVAVPQSWFLWCQDMLFFQPRWDDDSMTFYDFHIFGLKVDTTRKIGHSWTVDLPTWSEILKCEPDLGWPSPFFFFQSLSHLSLFHITSYKICTKFTSSLIIIFPEIWVGGSWSILLQHFQRVMAPRTSFRGSDGWWQGIPRWNCTVHICNYLLTLKPMRHNET